VHPQEGRISVGRVAIDAATVRTWQTRIAYVPQDGFLFHDTLRRNLTWDNAGIDDDATAWALVLAGAGELVRRLPAGLDTVLGERGARLSGGERQRIGLARALLRKSDLLILDEATNALDPAAERDVLARLARLDPRPTIIMIAHHAASLSYCDRLFHVEAGAVTEVPLRDPATE
jgi:ATP-binding cassette subfamily C protein